jgi:hypothetical protein
MLASGTVAGEIVFKTYYDKTVISKKPDMSKRVLSKRQIDMNHRMKDAHAYAKGFYGSDEEKLKARLRLKLPAHKSLYHALLKEWLDRAELEAAD